MSVVHKKIDIKKILKEKANLSEILEKDLLENEDICPTCGGLGMVVCDNRFGLNNNNTYGFPYENQAFAYCPTCHNGVVKRCPYCNEVTSRIRNACSCKQALNIKQKEKEEKFVLEREEHLKNAKEVTVDELNKRKSDTHTNICLHSEELDEYFFDIDDYVDRWNCEEEGLLPEILWVTETIYPALDAADFVESMCNSLHEDAYDNCDIHGLQKLLDDWTEKQTDAITYCPSYKEYVVVKE